MMKLSNRVVTISRSPIFFGNNEFSNLDRLVKALRPHTIHILADPNTRKLCLPLLLERTNSLTTAQVIEIGEGEAAKSLGNAGNTWNELVLSGADRSSLLINLGGGVVSDLGGFVAAGYMRGIRYLNVPTSLMGQADAAIGGKTGVNLDSIKNQVGFFHAAGGIFIIPEFLKTLPMEHLRSGLAEIIKSTIIGNETQWRRLSKHPVAELLNLPVENKLWMDMISNSLKFKNRVVKQDYYERKHRKVLNFGHTIGHALEGLSHREPGIPLLHGEAVAAGMICASYLSHRKTGLEQEYLDAIKSYLVTGFPHININSSARSALMDLLAHDKKNRNGEFHFTLISKPGRPLTDVKCNQEEISNALDYYNACQ